MAKFKSLQSGDVYEYLSEQDIETMRSHDEYVEVEQEAPKPKKKQKEQ